MRHLFALALLLSACAADPVLLPDSGPCSSACGAGTVCSGGACVAVDGGSANALQVVDVGEDRPVAVDLGSPADAGFDAGPVDAGAVDAVVDVPRDVDPRRSEVCRAVNATCDGRIVDVQRGERDGGLTHHCGGCGISCAAGMGCLSCVCIPL